MPSEMGEAFGTRKNVADEPTISLEAIKSCLANMPTVDELLVDLVGEHHHVRLQDSFGQGRQLFRRVRHAGGIARGAD